VHDRNLWGVENFEEITIRIPNLPHSVLLTRRHRRSRVSLIPRRPPFIAGIKAARERIVARSDEDRENFLLSALLQIGDGEDHRDVVERRTSQAREHLDFVQGITRSPAPRPIRTPASNWRARPGNCWSAPPDTNEPRGN